MSLGPDQYVSREVAMSVSADSGVAPERVLYATRVYDIGEMIPSFRQQGLLIFFGEMAPEELHDFVIRHRPTVADSVPRAGDVIELDGDRFTIGAVGEVVEDNLRNLGHFSLKADGATTAPLPGDICVEARDLPELQVGSTMRILTRIDADSAAGDSGSGIESAVSGDPGSTAHTPQEETT
jgi:PTS system glucitol/sorbitol-specific IIA component